MPDADVSQSFFRCQKCVNLVSVLSWRQAPAAGRFRAESRRARVRTAAASWPGRIRQRRGAGGVGLGRDAGHELGVSLYLDAAKAPMVERSGGSSCRLRASSKIRRAASCSQILVVERRPAPSRASAGLVESAPRSGPFSACFNSPEARQFALGVSVVCRLTAALRISARTTSSVIRALWAIRSANWSRAAASGIQAATGQHLAQKLPPRFRRVPKSRPAAARSSRYSRYGRELAQSFTVRVGAVAVG